MYVIIRFFVTWNDGLMVKNLFYDHEGEGSKFIYDIF